MEEPTKRNSYGKRPMWQWILIYAVIGIVIYGIVYYFFFAKKGNNYKTRPPEPTSSTPKTVSVALSEQNKSGESGTATLTEVNGKVNVTLTLTGAPANVTQPAHIHVGPCPDVGAVKYALAFPVNGKSETELNVTLDQLRSELPLVINVHKSGAEANVYVSCGDLAL